MNYIYLSYTLNENTPVYGGGESLRIEQIKDMEQGDSCNTQYWKLPNHLGTHIDAPKHFARSGKSIEDFNADFWVSKRPYWIDIKPINEKEIINSDYLNSFSIPEDIDLLLIKTGFGSWREDESYYCKNPGFAPELADYLRDRFHNLKMIGFDVISLSSFSSRNLGRKAHKQFLDHEKPILPIEDMNLSSLESEVTLKKVFIVPICVQGADAAPSTIIAEINT